MFLYFAMVTVYQNSESRLFGLKWNFTFSKHRPLQRRSIFQAYYTSYCRGDYPPPSLNSNSFGCVTINFQNLFYLLRSYVSCLLDGGSIGASLCDWKSQIKNITSINNGTENIWIKCTIELLSNKDYRSRVDTAISCHRFTRRRNCLSN